MTTYTQNGQTYTLDLAMIEAAIRRTTKALNSQEEKRFVIREFGSAEYCRRQRATRVEIARLQECAESVRRGDVELPAHLYPE